VAKLRRLRAHLLRLIPSLPYLYSPFPLPSALACASLQDSNEADRTRASEVVNPLLPSGGMATSIASSSDAPAGAAALQRTQARQHSADSGLEKHFMQMKFICDRLGLANRHKERADELFKQMHDQGQAKRKHAAAQAACVYIACRMENREHTFREICAAAPGTNVKDISRMVQALKSVLKEEQPLSSKSAQKAADPKQHVGNFYTGMGVMDKETVSATKRMVDNFIALRSEDPTLTSYRQPATIAGACIYLALLVKDERAKSSEGRRKLWNSLQESSGMKQPTLAAAFRQDIFPRRVKIVPAELASSEEVQALSGVVN